MADKPKNLNKEIEDILDNKKLRHFVRWYCDGADPKKYKNIQSYCNNVDMNFALDTYLEREDVKKAISITVKSQAELNLVKVYNAMLKKALEGDVNSANWLVKFSDSKFFKGKKSVIDELVGRFDMSE
ncbi:hypothetical protein QTH11_04150 [Clostridium perfringens]|uniref:hypothetical protein n=1 Tax=Clostridium perfringens TaxID=1502 RepID=UPI00016BD743|nr:hypothetical protein [Clostridium perfringens]EDT27572.1 hypothetical protein AC5_1530 [Clostridium perfringens CPE str. F4969]EGT2192767.1 hypothetical protein [Clostridium perfringens]EHA0993881.1 hypothetical protein [Clostridium perfringens]EHA1184230.1 hypothetical protein [Clostridium perfringens]EJT6142230.1 hypothetical protein [Clostridium perfringens]